MNPGPAQDIPEGVTKVGIPRVSPEGRPPLGGGDSFLILELNNETGEMAPITNPFQVNAVNGQVFRNPLSFPTQPAAQDWLDENGAVGFRYLIVKGVADHVGAVEARTAKYKRACAELHALLTASQFELKAGSTEDTSFENAVYERADGCKVPVRWALENTFETIGKFIAENAKA